MKWLFLLLLTLLASAYYFPISLTADNPKVGRQYVYSYQSQGLGYSDIGQLYSTDTTIKPPFFRRPNLQNLKVDLTCTVQKTILQQTNNGYWVSFEVQNPSLQIENNGLTPDVELLKQELTRPIFAQLNVERPN